MRDKVNPEVLAAISAALASFNNNGTRLVVKSFRRIPQMSPIWNLTGRIENLKQN